MQEILGLENINKSLSTHYLIYKITNNINGKYYIGQHKTNNPLDNYMGSGKFINNAEQKYGLSSFTKEILFDFDNFEDMNNKEIELVQLSNCWPYDQMSYNLTEGGCTQGYPVMYGEINPMYGKKHKMSSIYKMSDNNTGTQNKKWIFNNTTQTNKCVLNNELEYYLSIGWKLGRLNIKQPKNKITHLGLKWVHNAELRLETQQSECNLRFYLNMGWKYGRLPKKLRQKTSNKKIWKWMINKELKMKCRVYVENFDYFLSIGFKFGSRITRLKN